MQTPNRTPTPWFCLVLAWAAVAPSYAATVVPAAPCRKPLYLTFDTGHMEVAPLIAEVLLENGKPRLIRRRQTIQELLELENIGAAD